MPRLLQLAFLFGLLATPTRAACRNGDWQNAIDAAARSGGGTVEVPAGVWVSPPLELKSGVTLRLAKGAVLRADVGNPDYSNRVVSAFIRAQGASNVSLVGEGTVEGGGAAFAPKSRRPHLVDFRECRDVLVEGVTLRDGASWTLFPCSCIGVTIRGVRIVSHVNHNNDGIDVASSNVLIEDCDIDSGDDALVFKTPDSRMVLENIRVRNCRLASGCNAIKFGTESKGIVRHVTIEGCKVEPPSVPSVYAEKWLKAIPGCQTRLAGISGIALECVDGGSLESVTVRDVTVRGVQTPVFVRLGSRRPALPGRRSYLRDVLIENVEGVASSRIACSITGVEGLRPAGITVRNCRFEFPGGGTVADATSRIPEKADKYPENSMFNRLPLPAYGFYVRHADGVRLENVELSLARGATDARPPVKAEDADVRVLDSTVRTQVVEGAPFPLSVEVADIPTREFRIDAYGARPGDRPVTESIARTVEACVKAGGGRVVVPAGRWVTGPVFLASNVDLHLAEGAVLHFPDDPAMHPVVKDISRGLRDRPAAHVYAVGCTNVAVTGKGTIESAVGYWHKNLKKTLRPQTLFFGHCKRVRLEGFRIRGSASWTIHVFATDDVVVRSIDSLCHGPNTDGLDLDSVGRALVEDCRFDQGDDGFCIKSGINQEGRERGLPSHDIVIRRCTVVNGHTLLGIGSELSGGIRNVFLTDCTVANDAWRFLRVKTNPDRGGFVENVYLQNVSGKKAAHAVFQLETDYYWKPSPGKTAHHTRIRGVHLSNVTAEESPFGVRLEGSPEMPPEDITVENLVVGRVKKELERVRNVRGYVWRTVPRLELQLENKEVSNENSP